MNEVSILGPLDNSFCYFGRLNFTGLFHLTGAFPFSVGCYVVYMNLDKLWQEPPSRFTPLQNFINGCLAAGVAQTLSYPFETVKRKMQVNLPPGHFCII